MGKVLNISDYKKIRIDKNSEDRYSIMLDRRNEIYIAVPSNKEHAVFSNTEYSKLRQELDIYIKQIFYNNPNQKPIIIYKEF